MEREVYTINAQGKILGRLASEIALLLRGKNKTSFQPHKDEGPLVIVENSKAIKVTGQKKTQKKYYRHTGYLGGLKEETMENLEKRKPGEVLRKAVMGMLPKNKLRSRMIKRLRIK